MPCPLLIFSQSDILIWIVAINSHTKWQTVQIQISWLLQKPTDLDLHCLHWQGVSGFSRTRVVYLMLCLKIAGWLTNSISPDETLFANHLGMLHTFTGSKMDFWKKSIWKSVSNFSIYPKFPMKMKFWVKGGLDWTPLPTPNTSDSTFVLYFHFLSYTCY